MKKLTRRTVVKVGIITVSAVLVTTLTIMLIPTPPPDSAIDETVATNSGNPSTLWENYADAEMEADGQDTEVQTDMETSGIFEIEELENGIDLPTEPESGSMETPSSSDHERNQVTHRCLMDICVTFRTQTVSSRHSRHTPCHP